MAELVGLVASIGTIASAGLAVAKAISTLADELGSAGTQIKAISTDTKAVALILHELRRRLNKSTKINRQAFEVANEIADLCKVDIDNIKQCLLPISPSDNGKMDVTKKTRWLLAKSKIAMRRTSLDSLKLTLTLFLHTLDFIEGDVIDESYIQDEVEGLVTRSKNTKTRFLNAERTDQHLEKAYDSARFSDQLADRSNGDDDDRMGDAHELLHCDIESSIGEEGAMVWRRNPVNDEQDIGTSVMNPSQVTDNQLFKVQTSELEIMESLSDDHFLRIAQHIRTQKVVTSYALVVLDRSHDKDFSTTTSTSNLLPEKTPTSRVEVPSGHSPRLTTKDSDGTAFFSKRRWSKPADTSGETSDDEAVSVSATDGWDELFRDARYYSSKDPHYYKPPTNRRTIFTRDFPRGRDRESSPERPRQDRRDGRMPPRQRTYTPGLERSLSRSRQDNGYTVPPRRQAYTYGSNNPYNVSREMPRGRRTPSPPTPDSRSAFDDPEKVAMKRQLAEIEAIQRKKEDEDARKQLEARIRAEAELAFNQKIEQMQREEKIRVEERNAALMKAQHEIEQARKEAERAAREAIEAEGRAEAERAKKEAEVMAAVEVHTRERLEAEWRAQATRRKGFRGLFGGSPATSKGESAIVYRRKNT